MILKIEKNVYKDGRERFFINEYGKENDQEYFIRTSNKSTTTLEEAKKNLEELKKTLIANKIVKSEIIHEEEF